MQLKNKYWKSCKGSSFSAQLTQCGLDRVNIGSDNGLLSDGTKPLPEPILIYHQWSPLAFTWWQFQKEILKISINEMCFKFINLKFQPDLPGANELNPKTRTFPVCNPSTVTFTQHCSVLVLQQTGLNSLTWGVISLDILVTLKQA